MTLALWTFVADYEGGTYIAQTRAEDLSSALKWYALNGPKVAPIAFTPSEDFFEAIPIQGTQNVWCTGALGPNDTSLLLNVIRTADPKVAPQAQA